MKTLIEKIYEAESEDSMEMEALEKEFERKLHTLVNEILDGLPEEQKDEFSGRLIGILIPMEKEWFAAGFKCAVRLLVEGIL